MNQALQEGLLEAARLAVFAAVGAAVSYVLEYVMPSLDQTQTVAVLTLVLRFVDKYVHESDNTAKGILPF